MISPSKSPEEYLKRATEASANGEWHEAAKRWQKLIRKFSDDYPPEAWL